MNETSSLFYKPIFWFLFFLLSLISGFISYKYFRKSMSLLEIEVSVNKEQALEKARELSNLYNIGPRDFHQAAIFCNDTQLQNYVELEVKDKSFQELVQDKIYYPYTWQIRHFKENEAKECIFKLTPDGKPYSFIENVSENETGSALNETEAINVVESKTLGEWGIDLDKYQLIEKANEKRSNGRIDYTFTYQRKDYAIGLACLKLNICVCGNKVSTINHYFDIPESFIRKFEEMKETNQNIISFSQIIIHIFFLFIGCLGGTFFLIRRNSLIVKPAIIWGILISSLQVFAILNQMPQIWFSYITSHSITLYCIEKMYEIIFLFFAWAAMNTIIFMVAEGLTRKAFGNQIQLWKTWNIQVASSKKVVGLTLASYLLVALLFVYVIFFYILGKKYFGWWSPSWCLTDPNILSTYFPSLNPFILALRAGFKEECMFRAIPIAGCALIGKRLGVKNFGIVIGLIVQSIIFGTAHAHYATLPGYVRVIELILPSFVFGTLYIKYGLMPSIIVHFVYDAILFSLPIFIANAPGIFIHKLLAILGIFAPLLIIISALLISKKFSIIPQALYNSNWIPPKKLEFSQNLSENESDEPAFIYSSHYTAFLSFITLFGISSLLLTNRVLPDIQRFQITKDEAIEKAKEILKHKGIALDENYKPFTKINQNIESNNSLQEKYIWQVCGQKIFNDLRSTYLLNNICKIRFAKFEGSQFERTKEYYVFLDRLGELKRFKEILPEQENSTLLSEAKARKIAIKFIEKNYGIPSTAIIEISAIEIKRPNRKDWQFSFKDLQTITNENVEPRISILIAGDKVVDYKQYIHIPEKWARDEEKKQQQINFISYVSSFAYFLMLILAFIQFIQLGSKRNYGLTRSVSFAILYAFIAYMVRLLNFSEILFNFTTSKSFASQLWTNELMALINLVIDSIILTIFFTLISNKDYRRNITKGYKGLAIGFSISIFYIGLISIVQFYIYPSAPTIIETTGFTSTNPYLFCLGTYMLSYLKNTLIVLFLCSYANGRLSLKTILALVISTIIFMPYSSYTTVTQTTLAFTVILLAFTLLYFLVLKYDNLILPIVVAICMSSNIIFHSILQRSSGIILSEIISIFGIIISAIFLIKILYSKNSKAILTDDAKTITI